MNEVDNTNSPIDMKTQAEIDKLRAEARQADAETAKIHRDIKRPWYRGALFFQAIAAGLVAVPIVWFYVKEVAIPLHEAKNIKLERQIEKSLSELQNEKAQHAEAVKRLIEEKEESSRNLLGKLNDLRVRYESIENTRQELKAQYEKLFATHQLTSADRSKLRAEYDELKSTSASKASDISAIEAEIAAQKTQNLSAGERFAQELRKLESSVSPDSASYERSIALVVGVDSSEDKYFTPLPGVSIDTKKIVKVFTDQDFQVTRLVNPTTLEVRTAFGEAVQTIGPKDRIVIYWAGHGFSSEEAGSQRGYLATKDCLIDYAYKNCISMESIPDLLERLGAKSALALIDASFAGLALQNTRGLRLAANFQPLLSKEIIAASNSSGVVFDSSRAGLGPFAAGITEGLGEWKADFNDDGIIRTSELFQYLSSSIVQLTQGRQVPSYASLSPNNGEFLFSRPSERKSASR